jgi:hypothetical protein
MNFDDIEVNEQYMIYEENIGQVKVLAKHVVGGRELIWYQKGNDHGFGQPKFFSPIPMNRGEVTSQFVSDIMAFIDKPYTSGELYDFISHNLMILITGIENGMINWYNDYDKLV